MEITLPATLTIRQYSYGFLTGIGYFFLDAILLQVSTAEILRISETKLKKERFKREILKCFIVASDVDCQPTRIANFNTSYVSVKLQIP